MIITILVVLIQIVSGIVATIVVFMAILDILTKNQRQKKPNPPFVSVIVVGILVTMILASIFQSIGEFSLMIIFERKTILEASRRYLLLPSISIPSLLAEAVIFLALLAREKRWAASIWLRF
jgi:hypothetical protein